MATHVLKPEGKFVAKALNSQGYNKYMKAVRTSFDKVVIH